MKVCFLGSKPLGLKVAQALYDVLNNNFTGIITTDDSDDARTELNGFIEYSSRCGLPISVLNKGKGLERNPILIQSDFCVVAGWYWLLKPSILNSISGGFVGIHNSLLPKFRGGSPLVWTILAGESKAGFSIFKISEGIDDGPIWGQYECPIDEDTYVGDLLITLEEKAVMWIKENIERLICGSLIPWEQNNRLATYSAIRIPDDGIIDWKRSASSINRQIHALSTPYPCAFTYLDNEKIKISRSRVLKGCYWGTNGQVVSYSDLGAVIICNQSEQLLIEKVVLEGKEQCASSIFNSLKIRLH